MKRQHKIFADKIIKGIEPAIAYQSAYPKSKGEAARVNSYKLLHKYTISAYIATESNKIRAMATQQAITELKEEIKTNFLAASTKRELLFKIANGELEIESIVVTKEGIKKVKTKPSHADIMKAIDLDNKMAGDFAPTKVAQQTEISGNLNLTNEPVKFE